MLLKLKKTGMSAFPNVIRKGNGELESQTGIQALSNAPLFSLVDQIKNQTVRSLVKAGSAGGEE